jgi:hypothetical protein
MINAPFTYLLGPDKTPSPLIPARAMFSLIVHTAEARQSWMSGTLILNALIRFSNTLSRKRSVFLPPSKIKSL